jgi:hypothetical protein
MRQARASSGSPRRVAGREGDVKDEIGYKISELDEGQPEFCFAKRPDA